MKYYRSHPYSDCFRTSCGSWFKISGRIRRISAGLYLPLCMLLLIVLNSAALFGQGTWMMNGRTHPELDWFTVRTSHFRIHYHAGLKHTAEATAHIAEQIYPVLLRQVELDEFGPIHITLTAEDEIMNGYAMPSNQIFIWVRQSQAAGRFAGSQEWLRLVVAHELQHVVLLRAVSSWLGIWNHAFVPMWFIEGTAEYYTERWRVERSDARMKMYTYKNVLHRLDPHDEGYAKVLYLVDKYGDSTLAEIARWRHKTFGYYDFREAFLAATGQTVSKFHEEWRRAMNTYYYSYRGQKERIEDVGEVLAAPKIRYVYDLTIAPDSSTVAFVGKISSSQRYQSIYLVTTDSTRRVSTLHSGRFGSAPAWTSDGKTIIVSEYHRGAHGSLLYDLRKINTHTGEKTWLTRDMRAHKPVIGRKNNTVYFVASPTDTAHIYSIDLHGTQVRRISQFGSHLQVNDPALSPDGEWLAYMVQNIGGNVDIAVMDTAGEYYWKLTDDSAEDLLPVWGADGKSVIFTSYRNSTPNLYKVSPDAPGELVQLTDVASGIFGKQRVPGSEKILAIALADVDTPRVVFVDPDRTPETGTQLVLREEYRNWRSRQPSPPLPEISVRTASDSSWRFEDYRFWRHPRELGSLVLPTPTGIGGFTAWNDAMGKHLVFAGGIVDYPPYSHGLFDGYLFLYNTAALPPFLTVGVLKNSSALIQPYDQGWLIETRRGGFVLAVLPLNWGTSLYSNHRLSIGATLYTNKASLLGTHRQERPPPESGDIGKLTLRYRWLSRKPDRNNRYLPTQGWGGVVNLDGANQSFYGQYSYQKIHFDTFLNRKVYGPVVFYIRGSYMSIAGSYPVQAAPGITDDVSLYFTGNLPAYLPEQPLLETRENYQLRGTDGIMVGERLFYTTVEARLPVLPSLPVHFFGIRVGRTSCSWFIDHGSVWSDSGRRSKTAAGFEFRTAVEAGGYPILHLGYGMGNTIRDWRTGKSGNLFFRIGLVNPF